MAQDGIEQYAQWSMKRSPLSPKHFHENIALTLYAGAAAGRIYVQLPHDAVYSNIWTLVIAKTTVFGKTTTFNKTKDVTKDTMNEKIIREIATPESFIEVLSGKQPENYDDLEEEEQKFWDEAEVWQGRRLFILDEAGRLFNIMKKDYNSDLADIFMALFDPTGNPVSRRTRSHGSESIRKYALSCLFATTPAGIRSVLNTSDSWSNGFWIRWNFVAEETMTAWRESVYADPPKEVLQQLHKISRVLLEPYTDKPLCMKFDNSFLKVFNENTRLVREQINATENEQLHGFLGRLPISHIKAAMIYALLEADKTIPTLQVRHWDMAQHFVEGWLRDVQRVIKLASQNDRMTKEERVRQFVFGSPLGTTVREIARHVGISTYEAQSLTDTLEKGGEVIPNKKGRAVIYIQSSTESKIK